MQHVADVLIQQADKVRDVVIIAGMSSAPVWLGTLNEVLAAGVGVCGVVYGFFKACNEIAAWKARRAAKKD
jgi:hypothetical protein